MGVRVITLTPDHLTNAFLAWLMHQCLGTSPGQMLRTMRAEVRRQGPDRVPGKVAS